MFHPSRGGVRGGKDQFNWDDVKSDKDRENYLGHSLKAPVGRWQKGKDLLWYTREKGETPITAAVASASADEQRRAEIQRVKDEEEQLMREALGLAPKRAQRPSGHIEKKDAEQLFKREKQEEEARGGERVQGLGFGPVVHVEGALQGERPAGTLEGEATPAPDHLDPLGASVKTEQNAEGLHEDVKPPPPPPGAPSAAALKEQRREERRRKKEERRAAKKARKEERKRRREERKRRRELSDSSEESDSDVSHGSRKKRRRPRSDESSGSDSGGRDEKVDKRDGSRKHSKQEGPGQNVRDGGQSEDLDGLGKARGRRKEGRVRTRGASEIDYSSPERSPRGRYGGQQRRMERDSPDGKKKSGLEAGSIGKREYGSGRLVDEDRAYCGGRYRDDDRRGMDRERYRDGDKRRR